MTEIQERLFKILEKRNGGAINIRGIYFQLLYACYRILAELKNHSGQKAITLEGLEDIDINSTQLIIDRAEYVQVKTSENKMDAGTFWNLGVLQNFLAVYIANPGSSFRLIHNVKFTEGNITALIKRKKDGPVTTFWQDKLTKENQTIDLNDFLNKINFEFTSANELHSKIISLLFTNWNVNKGTEKQFFTSLFFNILVWSKNRSTIRYIEIKQLFQNILDSFSISPVNKAIQNNWITKVSYDQGKIKSDDYYEGKAAKPSHIAQGLPVRRKVWENQIEDTLKKSDIVLLRSSSGQGKSTLAWQVGYNLQKDYSIYQVHTCRDTDEANSIAEFLKSRLMIGQMPLVIIDGLNQLVSSWSTIAEKTSELPIKLLITSRQEDWFRYGADISKITVNTIDIKLSIHEARDIFELFKKKNRIHTSIKQWQPLWEKLDNKGLLIEFTYLMTFGEMISERIYSQVKYLNESKSSRAKMEILRMVSLADCLNIKLKTGHLLKYLDTEVGFEQDKDYILSELTSEYMLVFDDSYIEGLHPVRSNHLKDSLHKTLPLQESLMRLYHIVDEKYKSDFFIHAPTLLTESGKQEFYYTLSDQLSKGEIFEMVMALDGIMYAEPKRYWMENKEIYDQADNLGGSSIFSMTTVPFTNLNTLDELSKTIGENGNVYQQLSELKKKLPEYSRDTSDVYLFAKTLGTKIKQRTAPFSSYQGLEFLMKWFTQLGLPLSLPFLDKIRIDDLLAMKITEAKEWILYFQISSRVEFNQFIETNKDRLISYLKVNTNSLTIKQTGSNLDIQYLLFDNEFGSANELSAYRIQVIHAFFPCYEKYCTEAIMLPFPSENIISTVKQNSKKSLTEKAIGDIFNSHLNKIWYKTVEANYQPSSGFEWQENILNIRRLAVDWSKDMTRLVDSLIESNAGKRNNVYPLVEKSRTQLSKAMLHKKSYPRYGQNYYDKTQNFPEETNITKWIMSLINVNNQIFNVFIPEKQHERNLAMINLRELYFDLSPMQDAFRAIEGKTAAYFDSEEVCREENKCFERLYITINFYIHLISLNGPSAILVARKAAEEWWAKAKDQKLKELNKYLSMVEQTHGYEFIKPDKLEETPTLTYAVFGIKDFDFSDDEAVKELSFNLTSLSNLPIDFFSIFAVSGNTAINGFRFTKEYFEAFGYILRGSSGFDFEKLMPLQVLITENNLKTLPGVSPYQSQVVDAQKEIKVKILFDLWKLSEFRERLDREFEIEKKWLQNEENRLTRNINNLMNSLLNPDDRFMDRVKHGIKGNTIFSQKEIIDELNEIVYN